MYNYLITLHNEFKIRQTMINNSSSQRGNLIQIILPNNNKVQGDMILTLKDP